MTNVSIKIPDRPSTDGWYTATGHCRRWRRERGNFTVAFMSVLHCRAFFR
jgi:hypothetical protein